MSKQTFFFATRSDLLGGAITFEERRDLQYVLCRMTNQRQFTKYKRLRDVENLGTTDATSHIAADCYMVLDAGTELNVEEIPQRRGGTMYALGQQLNPFSIILR